MMGSVIGVWRVAARRTGLAVDAYLARRDAGDKFCWRCRAWHPRGAFGRDRARGDRLSSSCRTARNGAARRRYQQAER